MDGILIVAFAEHQDGSGLSVVLQRSSEFDEQDLRLGMDTYSISTETGATASNALAGWEVVDRRIVLSFDLRSADALGLGNELRIDVPPNDVPAVIASLCEITKLNPGDTAARRPTAQYCAWAEYCAGREIPVAQPNR
jgi:hypothetical protein